MQFEYQGMSLWYGTPDAPAPGESVPAGAEVAIAIGVRPIDASHRVELLYRINQGSIETVVAKWQRNQTASNSQYFKARLPRFQAGDTVEYRVICRCAGRQVPSPEKAEHFAGSFRVIEPGTQLAPTMAANESSPPEPDTVASTPNVEPELTAQQKEISPPSLKIENRINIVKTVLTNKEHQRVLDEAVKAANENIPVALESLKDKLPPASLQKVTLAHSLAVLTDDHLAAVKALTEQPDLTTLRDVALRFNVEKLAAIVDPKALPESIAGATDDEEKRNFAIALQHKLFAAEPTAVLQRMVEAAEVPIADVTLRTGVVRFLANQPDFNIRTTSVYTALQHPEAFKDIADEHRAGVVEQLKTLQRVQAISPIPEAVPTLMRANLTSAFSVAEMPESTFLAAHGQALGEETARQVYTTAINSHIRNEHALITMREAVRGTGLAIIDGSEPLEARRDRMQAIADGQAVPLNLESLFGSIDYCECEECLSVYSPASYFVELLQFLRNNNLDPNNPNTGQKGIVNTPLEKLFRRRPDLGCLELTCQNTFTVLPYIDLVNEVMESFVVHLDEFDSDPNVPKQARLEVFNVEDEISSELLAQPQHTNYDAYCILKNAVYPFTLPYHQAIDGKCLFSIRDVASR
jgi:hypothetical protein